MTALRKTTSQKMPVVPSKPDQKPTELLETVEASAPKVLEDKPAERLSEASVSNFQTQAGLKPTGQLDTETAKKARYLVKVKNLNSVEELIKGF